MKDKDVDAILKLMWARIEKERNAAEAKAAGSPTEDIEMSMAHEYAAGVLADVRHKIHDGFAMLAEDHIDDADKMEGKA